MKENKMKFLFVLLFSLSAWAGNEKGNGGNFLACVKDGQTTFTLLDFFEYPAVDQNRTIGSWQVEVQNKIDKIKKLSPLRGQYFSKLLEVFNREVQFKSGGNFSSSGDVGPILIPTDCSLVQAATQIRDPNNPRYGFYLNTEVWGKISELQKAGLVLHELLLTEAIESGHESSVRTRILNGKIWADEFDNKDANYFQEYLKSEIGLRFVDKTTYWMELFDDNGNPRHNEFWPSGKPSRIFSRKGAEICVRENCFIPTGGNESGADLYFDLNGNLTAATAESGNFIWNGQPFHVKGRISFFPSGKMAIISLASPIVWRRGEQNLEITQMVMFYESGQIDSFTFENLIAIPVLTKGVSCVLGSFKPFDSVSFHRNGVLKEAYIYASCYLRTVSGKVERVQQHKVQFNEKGLIPD